MQGTSESWQRLDRMRSLGAGPTPGAGGVAEPAAVTGAGPAAPPSMTGGSPGWVPDDGRALDDGVDAAPGPGRPADASSRLTDPGEDDPALGGGDGYPDADPDPPRRRRAAPRWRVLLRRRFARSAELWVPQALQGARVDPGRRGLMALLLVAALAASITAVGVWRDRPQPASSATVSVVTDDPATDRVVTSPSDPPSSDPVARTGTLAATETTANAEIVVSVTGLVIRPGVVTLPAGSRVAAAIAAAGGLAPAADVTGLNLAARLDDGASVIVTGTGGAVSGAGPGSDVTGSSGSAGSGGARIDLNSADVTELDTLPGVGPVMAGNIVAWREQNGPFTSIEQLQEISGIGPARYAQLAELVVVA